MELSNIVLAVIAVLAALALTYPYVEGTVLRILMIERLRSELRASGYKCRRFYKNPIFLRNRSPRYDMVVYNETNLYAVKLWSSYFMRNELIIRRDGRVCEQRDVRDVFDIGEGKGGSGRIRGFFHSVPRTRLPKKYTRGREIENVLLIYPSYKSIAYVDGGKKVTLGTGDELFEKTLYSPSSFISALKKASFDSCDEENAEKDVKTEKTAE